MIYRSAIDNIDLAVRWVLQFEKVIAYLEQTAMIFRESGDQYGEATALGNLGLTLAKTRQYSEARQYAERAAVLFNEAGADEDAAWARKLAESLTT
jgi:tetratricopeptide (TPR) repeat protein